MFIACDKVRSVEELNLKMTSEEEDWGCGKVLKCLGEIRAALIPWRILRFINYNDELHLICIRVADIPVHYKRKLNSFELGIRN